MWKEPEIAEVVRTFTMSLSMEISRKDTTQSLAESDDDIDVHHPSHIAPQVDFTTDAVIGTSRGGSCGSGTDRTIGRRPRLRHATVGTIKQASIDHLCQAIADRVAIRRGGSSGNIALKPPRRLEESRDGERGEANRTEEDEAGDTEMSYSGGGRRGSAGLIGSLGGGMSGDEAGAAGAVRKTC